MHSISRVAAGVLLATLLTAARTDAQPGPGCVELLLHCDPASELIQELCGPGPHVVPPGDTSYVVFGAGVTSVTLTQCGTGTTQEIFGDTDLCTLSGFNDNVCGLSITSAVPTLGGSTSGPIWMGTALTLLGVAGLLWRRRTQTD
jgi:hypothetical protein